MPALAASSEIDDIFASSSAKFGSAVITSKKTSSKSPIASASTPSGSSISTPKITPPISEVKLPKKSKRKSKLPTTVTEPSSSATTVQGSTSFIKDLKRQRLPETVEDPSIAISAAVLSGKKRRILGSGLGAKVGPGAEICSSGGAGTERQFLAIDEEEARFRDSRGTGPRRTTEEGYRIYKEDELGIQDEGGDTPLCPFDCNCCF